MTTTSKPWWQQATAVVSLGATGTITGFHVTPHGPDAAPKPTPAQVRLLALRQMAKPAQSTDVTFRSAIVNAAQYYLRLAQTRTPAEMEALIWEHDSIGGADHGQSCAAFASLTLELASKVVGRESWVTGGTSYPWPLHPWADVRVDPNPASLGVTSVLQDAQAHHRWHPLGDGYKPQPGDWVLFDGHVEVITRYSAGVLSTIGGDSLPNFSVNAHEYRGPLSDDGVAGFVDNAEAPTAADPTAAEPTPANPTTASPTSASGAQTTGGQTSADVQPGSGQAQTTDASIPGVDSPGTSGHDRAGAGGSKAGSAGRTPARSAPIPASAHAHRHAPATAGARARTQTAHTHHAGASQGFAPGHPGGTAEADVPGAVRFGPPATFQRATHDTAAIPGAGTGAHAPSGSAKPASSVKSASSATSGGSAKPAGAAKSAGAATAHSAQPTPATTAPVLLTKAQRAFIAAIAPGAIAAQHQYGVPASVTIAQAINESGWGQSGLATQSHNLFGMKGDGPAGSDTQLTDEYVDGHWQVTIASFRAYHDVAQSIEDHGKLLATSGDYHTAMDQRGNPDAFASALTGVYATNPQYGQDLIGLMQQYNLYQYDHATPAHPTPPKAPPTAPKSQPTPPAKPGTASIPGLSSPAGGSSAASTPSGLAKRRGGNPPGAGSHTTGPASGRGTSGHGSPGTGLRSTGPAAGRGGSGHGSRPRHSGTPAPVSTPPMSTPPTPDPSPRPSRPAPTTPPRATAPAPTSPSRTAPTTPPRATAPTSPSPSRTASTTPPRGTAPTPASPARTAAPPSAPATRAHTSAPVRTSPSTAAPAPPGAASPSRTAAPPPAPATRGRATAPTSPARPPSAPAAQIPGVTSPPPTSRTGSSRGTSARPTKPAPERSPGTKARPQAATLLAERTPAPAPRTGAAHIPAPAHAATSAYLTAARYDEPLPKPVRNSFVALARTPIQRSESLYQDVASGFGLRWELLATCDWMQCEAKPRYSPVHGEKLGTRNPDHTVYRTKSEALAQCAEELIELADAVYGIDLTSGADLSVRDLANVYAAFRWGALLKVHRTSAMEFPYSVAGLTVHKINMRWPNIDEPHAPDRPGTRFRMPFGAVPVLLCLDYPVMASPTLA